MNVTVVLENFSNQIRSQGLSYALRSLSRRVHIRFQEWRLGIYTEAIIELSEVGIYNAESKYYSATDYASIREIMRALDINPHVHVFLDFGAGLGRAMILIAMYPFRRVLGVEISRELSEIAEKNIARCKRKLRCQELEIVTCDATAYSIPPEVTIVYFNNPFFGQILAAVMANLRASLEAAPRELWIVCNLPQTSAFESQIASYNWLHLQKQFILSDNRRCFIYSAGKQ
jgi:predicted RNA methylase